MLKKCLLCSKNIRLSKSSPRNNENQLHSRAEIAPNELHLTEKSRGNWARNAYMRRALHLRLNSFSRFHSRALYRTHADAKILELSARVHTYMRMYSDTLFICSRHVLLLSEQLWRQIAADLNANIIRSWCGWEEIYDDYIRPRCFYPLPSGRQMFRCDFNLYI